MTDAALSLDEGESIDLFAYQSTAKGNLSIRVHVWQDDAGVLHISGDTKESGNDTFQIEVQHGVITKFERKD